MLRCGGAFEYKNKYAAHEIMTVERKGWCGRGRGPATRRVSRSNKREEGREGWMQRETSTPTRLPCQNTRRPANSGGRCGGCVEPTRGPRVREERWVHRRCLSQPPAVSKHIDVGPVAIRRSHASQGAVHETHENSRRECQLTRVPVEGSLGFGRNYRQPRGLDFVHAQGDFPSSPQCGQEGQKNKSRAQHASSAAAGRDRQGSPGDKTLVSKKVLIVL